jgi:hypothetical protein
MENSRSVGLAIVAVIILLLGTSIVLDVNDIIIQVLEELRFSIDLTSDRRRLRF